jgi:oligoendopeptidase F
VTTGATGIAWDLGPLMPGGADAVAAAGQGALSLAAAFSEAHRSQIGVYDAAQLRDALDELERVNVAMTAALEYAVLCFEADTVPPAHGALLTELEEVSAQVETLTTFFDLEWIAIDEVRAEQLLDSPELEHYEHLLRQLRRTKPHRLTEPEERILTEKAVSGVDAWGRLLDEQLSGLEVELDGDRLDLEQALARLSSSDRDQRRRAAEAVSSGLKAAIRTRAQILNVLLADHALDDRLRHYPHWLAELNLDNEATDESVQSLVQAVVSRYDIPQRWVAVKARALGLERLCDYDRLAPVGRVPEGFEWAEAEELVIGGYSGFSPELGRAANRFFDERWIDAEIRPGKVPGAYCASTVPAVNPYVLLNYSGRLDDVLTLAHELGHGLHFLLAAPRGLVQMHTPVTVAETASVFGETLTFAHLLSRAEDPAARLGLLAHQLDESVATVFKQIAIHRFEDAIHRERRERGELSVDRIGEHWMTAHRELYGDAMELTDGYRAWWSYATHVFSTPGYVYGYAYGQLMALSIYAQYLRDGDEFVPRYLELLKAGGSRSPAQLAQIVGVDVSDRDFWDTGLGLIDRQLAEAEEAAQVARRIAS